MAGARAAARELGGEVQGLFMLARFRCSLTPFSSHKLYELPIVKKIARLWLAVARFWAHRASIMRIKVQHGPSVAYSMRQKRYSTH